MTTPVVIEVDQQLLVFVLETLVDACILDGEGALLGDRIDKLYLPVVERRSLCGKQAQDTDHFAAHNEWNREDLANTFFNDFGLVLKARVGDHVVYDDGPASHIFGDAFLLL